MKIMIQWVTQSHSSMRFNLRPFENTFWNLMAALQCACIFWSIMVMVISSCTSYGKGVGHTVSVCGSICKIDICLDIFGPYNCWETYSVKKKLYKTPRSQIPDIFSVPRFQIFWASIPRFQIFWASIPWFQMLIHPPPPPPVKGSRTPASAASTLHEHPFSVMCGRWMQQSWTQYSGSIEHTNIVTR